MPVLGGEQESDKAEEKMIHYSCDRCRRLIESRQLVRYAVTIEVEAVLDTRNETEADDDRDCLLELDQMLEQLEDEVLDEEHPAVYQRKQFDLCPECYRQFIKNPMGREKTVPFGFSHN